jgi:hypothetical protein
MLTDRRSIGCAYRIDQRPAGLEQVCGLQVTIRRASNPPGKIVSDNTLFQSDGTRDDIVEYTQAAITGI